MVIKGTGFGLSPTENHISIYSYDYDVDILGEPMSEDNAIKSCPP